MKHLIVILKNLPDSIKFSITFNKKDEFSIQKPCLIYYGCEYYFIMSLGFVNLAIIFI